MSLRITLIATCAALSTLGLGAPAHGSGPVNVILDTDHASDIDDVAALKTLLTLEHLGEANILGAGVSVRNDWSALSIDAIATHYGRPGIPIGTAKAGIQDGSKYAKTIARDYPRSRGWDSADDVPDAIDVYRQVLASQPDNSVTFVTVGPLTNAAALLESGPDRHSDLNGRELVAQKVERMVTMGANFGTVDRPGGRLGKTYNISADWEASKAVFDSDDRWPTEVLFSPFKVGRTLETGNGLKALPHDDPVRRAYEIAKNDEDLDHPSYDQAAVHYAVRGFGGPAEGDYDIEGPGWLTVLGPSDGFEAGWNGFEDDPDGLHTYKNGDTFVPELIEGEIEALMTNPIPEPGSLTLLVLGSVTLLSRRRRQDAPGHLG